MPSYLLICRSDDGTEERSDLSADFGSGIAVGRTIKRDSEVWTIDEIVQGDPVTLIATRH